MAKLILWQLETNVGHVIWYRFRNQAERRGEELAATGVACKLHEARCRDLPARDLLIAVLNDKPFTESLELVAEFKPTPAPASS